MVNWNGKEREREREAGLTMDNSGKAVTESYYKTEEGDLSINQTPFIPSSISASGIVIHASSLVPRLSSPFSMQH